ncbi:MAG: hypothetical protein EPO26_03225 [Chloroflexota bacterium]|nr:MAG: hypothetical protein EPO26_03225 [Chloroflexota bacterium]
MISALDRLRALRTRPYNFLSRSQSSEGAQLASSVLDDLFRDRRLPSFAELAEIVTNPHALSGFHDWCQRTRRFTLWTREAIDELATYLRERGFTRVVEIGAGRGDLAWYLSGAGVDVVATDAGPRMLEAFTLPQYRSLPVEMWENVRWLDWRAALSSLDPDCVLCSWMPPDEDWTPGLRSAESVKEFVLFWELRGTTGGKSAFQRRTEWLARDIVTVEDWLIGRTDEGVVGFGVTQYTKATAFRRAEP